MTSEAEFYSFEKTRYEYCKRLFEQEVNRKEMNERKAQYYLTIITIFFGAVLFKFDIYKEIISIIHAQKKVISIIILINLLIFVFSIFFSLFSILQSFRVRKWQGGYPINTISALFSPNSKFLKLKTECEFLKCCAFEYIIAWEINQKINNVKAKWLQIAFYSISFSIASIFLFLFLIGYVLNR